MVQLLVQGNQAEVVVNLRECSKAIIARLAGQYHTYKFRPGRETEESGSKLFRPWDGPLLELARHSCNEELMNLVLHHENFNVDSNVLAATNMGDETLVKWLLETKIADVDARDPNSDIPWLVAVILKENHLSMVNLLFEHQNTM